MAEVEQKRDPAVKVPPPSAGPPAAIVPQGLRADAGALPLLGSYGAEVLDPKTKRPHPAITEEQKLAVERDLAKVLGLKPGELAIPLAHKNGSGPIFRDDDGSLYITGKIRPESERSEVGSGLSFKVRIPIVQNETKGIDYNLAGIAVNSKRDQDLIKYIDSHGEMGTRTLGFAARSPSGKTLFIYDRLDAVQESSPGHKGGFTQSEAIYMIQSGVELEPTKANLQRIRESALSPASKKAFDAAFKQLPEASRKGITYEALEITAKSPEDNRLHTHRVEIMFRGGASRKIVAMTWNGNELSTVVPPRQ